MKPFIRSPYNYDTAAVSLQTGTRNDEASRTVQSESSETDLNVLMRRVMLTGELVGKQMPPPLSEFQDVYDFQSAMNVIRRSQEAFAELPADLRFRFNNDPRLYVDFCTNPDNLPEMVKLGIAKEVKPPPVPEPLAVRVVNPDVPRETK